MINPSISQIHPLIRERVRKEYRKMEGNMTTKCKKIREMIPQIAHLSLQEVNYIAMMLTPEEMKRKIGRRTCPNCGHGENLVIEPIGGNRDDKPSRGYDIYCTTPTPQDVIFSRCWYHFPSIR